MVRHEPCLFWKYLKNKFPGNIYLFKANYRNTRKWSGIDSK